MPCRCSYCGGVLCRCGAAYRGGCRAAAVLPTAVGAVPLRCCLPRWVPCPAVLLLLWMLCRGGAAYLGAANRHRGVAPPGCCGLVATARIARHRRSTGGDMDAIRAGWRRQAHTNPHRRNLTQTRKDTNMRHGHGPPLTCLTTSRIFVWLPTVRRCCMLYTASRRVPRSPWRMPTPPRLDAVTCARCSRETCFAWGMRAAARVLGLRDAGCMVTRVLRPTVRKGDHRHGQTRPETNGRP